MVHGPFWPTFWRAEVTIPHEKGNFLFTSLAPFLHLNFTNNRVAFSFLDIDPVIFQNIDFDDGSGSVFFITGGLLIFTGIDDGSVFNCGGANEMT